MSAEGHATVVVADDDPAVRFLCRVNLELDGYRVREAASGHDLEAALADDRVDAVLLDIRLGSEDGVALARRLRELHPAVRIAFLSGSVERDRPDKGLELLAKPFTLEALAATVRRLVSR
jgi:two-component system OmpR family response regulator